MDCEKLKQKITEMEKRYHELSWEARELREKTEQKLAILKVECNHRKNNGESAWRHFFGESQCEICDKRAVHE